jgi:hypothetical protein
MSDIAVKANRVSKTFRRGELHDSLCDLLPALVKRLIKQSPEEHETGLSQ